MPDSPSTRSVKIGEDERGGWSSDRPRRGNAPERPRDISTRCRVMRPSDRIRYSPGSLLLILSPSAEAREAFAQRLITGRGHLLSDAKIRELLTGRVPDEQLDDKASELLRATARKRLEAGETTVVTLEGLDAEEREAWARLAAEQRRPRHVILLETSKENVAEEQRATLNELRTRLDSGELGQEGIQTALRLSPGTASELKRIVFAPPPRED
jgi:predicted kinase